MPRHRKERAPRLRALRRGSRSQRSAVGGVSRALRSGWGPAWSAAGRVAVRSRLRLARSLLVTPWFAAGAGIVIAAALAVNTPTALTYGPSGPGGLCTTHGCTAERRPQPPQVATASPGVAIRDPGAGAQGAGAAPDQPGATTMNAELSYQIVGHSGRGFVAVITMPGAGKTGWSLQFEFSGARIRNVMGARWHPSRDGAGGTADGPLPSRNQPSRATGSGQSGTSAGPRTPNADQMVVVATGRPQTPSSCTLDGLSCHFGTPTRDQAATGGDQAATGGDQAPAGG